MKVKLPEKTIDKIARRMHRGLVEFGYSDVGITETRDAVVAALNGEKPGGPPGKLVIEMLVRGWLEDVKVIKRLIENPVKQPKKRRASHYCTGYSCATCNPGSQRKRRGP